MIEPYEHAYEAPGERDLADEHVWRRSMERARHRRKVAELSHKHRQRRKATSVALTGAVATSPMLPVVGAATAETPGDAPSGQLERGDAPATSATLMRFGSTGGTVAQVQRRIGVDDDGIFGPITERAVKRFQSQHGLEVTGVVDTQTWAAIFRSQVVFLKAKDVPAVVREEIQRKPAETAAAPAEKAAPGKKAAPAKPARAASAPRRTVSGPTASGPTVSATPRASKGGGSADASRKLGRELRETVADTDESAPAPETRPAPKPETRPAVALGGGCSTVTPVKGIQTGSFGENRGTHRHSGIDISAPTGTAVRAASCGKVTQAGAQGAYGNLVCIDHGAGTVTCYAHLSSIAAKLGQQVAAGEVIGRVGSTGRSTGPHLHFEVRENGRAVDPKPVLSGTRELPSEQKRAMRATRTSTPTKSTTRSKRSTRSGGSRSAQPTATYASAPQQRQQAAPAQAQPAPAQPQAQAAPAQPQAPPAPAPEPQPAPAPQQASPAPAPAPAAEPAPAPAPAPAAQEPAPQPQPQPAPAPAEERVATAAAPAPAPVEQAPAPAPAPAPVEAAAAPVEAQSAPEPAPEPEAAAPAPEAPAPVEEPIAEAPQAAEAPAPAEAPAEAPAVADTPAAPAEVPAG